MKVAVEVTVLLSGSDAVGEQGIERLFRIAGVTAVREWRIPEQMYFLGNGHFTTVN